MSVSDAHEALRNSLERYFDVLSSGATEAAQLQPVLSELSRASRSILTEIVEEWHLKNDRLRRLPNEVIALCFAWLPFRDRVTVSHVSRGWRSIALMHPAVWADLDLGKRYNDKIALLEMALDRAGNHPVVIRNCPEPTRPASVGNILAAHMSHIQHLELPPRVFLAAINKAAPQLRFLQVQTGCHIRNDFLGGRVGQLKTLQLRNVILPETCPALSTVTDLTLHGPSSVDQATSFKRLFRLLPALQALSLMELEPAFVRCMPDGPAPGSLRRIALETLQQNYDVSEHYTNWHSERLSYVDIHQYTGPSEHLRRIVAGAIELVIGREYLFGWTSVVAFDALGRRRGVNFQSDSDDTHLVAARLISFRSTLESVHSMEVAATSFAGLLALIAALPMLARLTITIKTEDFLLHSHDFRWSTLSSLAQVAERRPDLQAIIINVICDKRSLRCPPSADDARDLLAQLETVAQAKLPNILVKGFSYDDLLGVQVPQFAGFEVHFENRADSA
ncbi:hypothetical protein AURDEDRAFT_163327 [Auricularia subglabra TFB-10046 SS5]|nr:hypothetical protein AURDEDRAFT_163327 [Auricularia subglabra TFB-10046 SS5]